MKNIIIVTGGAGFVGSNQIEFLIKKRPAVKQVFLCV